ncbi:uncharacterized protein LOC115708947 isoform X2 [Cannabis sativa]|uniref:uncharacterized protein LOC115708947 isoform X2 n=1 Tax=Cannabis sativa TaxID=3483 RepID=UPI0029CA79A0|nr:uncharacterized protein LOC115708947 isoform X2 [Cannabis sativa]
MKIALFQWALLGLWLWFSAVSFCQASSAPGIKNEDTFIPPSKKPCLKKFHEFFHHPIPKFKKSHPPSIPVHKPEPKPEPKPKSKPEPKSEPKPKKESKPKPKPKVEPKPIYKPHPFFKKPFFKFPHPKKPFPPSKS